MSHWIRFIRQRIRNNQNFVAFIGGQTGSGKTYSALRICCDVDPRFTVKNIVFSPAEFMKLVKGGKLRKGSAILWEEAGVALSSRNWQSTTNKVLNWYLQTFRHKNYILIFTSPYMNFVDSQSRQLFHALFYTSGINREEQKCRLRGYLLQYNDMNRTMYTKCLRLRTSKGTPKVRFLTVKIPDPETVKAYEELKKAFSKNLEVDIDKELALEKTKGNSTAKHKWKCKKCGKTFLSVKKDLSSCRFCQARLLKYGEYLGNVENEGKSSNKTATAA